MTNYHLKPPTTNSLDRSSWQEAKDKRKKQLEEVRQRRRLLYQRFSQKMRLRAT
jgi:hypothetical protein